MGDVSTVVIVHDRLPTYQAISNSPNGVGKAESIGLPHIQSSMRIIDVLTMIPGMVMMWRRESAHLARRKMRALRDQHADYFKTRTPSPSGTGETAAGVVQD